MEEETAVLNANERIHIKCRLKSIRMDLVTQRLLVTLANFHVSDQVTPLIKVFKASQCPPDKVISTPLSLLTTPAPSPQGPVMPNYSHDSRAPVLFPLPETLSSSHTPTCLSRLAQAPSPPGSLPRPPDWVGWSVVFSSPIAPCVGMSKVRFPPVTYIVHLGSLALWSGTAPLCSQACRQANLGDENGSASSFPLTR